MHAPDDGDTPSRSVMRRPITPWEYRHLRAVAGIRLAAGGFHLGIGVVLLGLGRRAETARDRRKCYGWAAWFLALAVLLLSGGYLDLTAIRTTPPRT